MVLDISHLHSCSAVNARLDVIALYRLCNLTCMKHLEPRNKFDSLFAPTEIPQHSKILEFFFSFLGAAFLLRLALAAF